MPKGQTPDDILRLAQNAEKHIVPRWKKVSVALFAGFAIGITYIPLQILTFVKWVTWNPIEYLAKGKVTSENPFEWFTKNMIHWWTKHADNSSERALNIYANNYSDLFQRSQKNM